ncbi:zinc finger protein 251 [Lingula anatina]|uniref:Zinc finger protein 251 n=1 Tax=Lingula anatina TaxID=7574 RepID=A0A1S3IZP8_LINAN|nr:zinc finger protein 251 [Lingula anatina]|eukprot:XP_013403488.1 zinc finger protein 251 [Lingula anatina]
MDESHNREMMNANGTMVYKCEKCSFTTAHAHHLRTHQETHEAEASGVYECSLCNYRTLHRYNLVVHQRTHTGELPYKCDICGKRFSQASTVRRHERIHTGHQPKPHRCPYCSYSAFRIVNVQKHVQEMHGSLFPGMPSMLTPGFEKTGVPSMIGLPGANHSSMRRESSSLDQDSENGENHQNLDNLSPSGGSESNDQVPGMSVENTPEMGQEQTLTTQEHNSPPELFPVDAMDLRTTVAEPTLPQQSTHVSSEVSNPLGDGGNKEAVKVEPIDYMYSKYSASWRNEGELRNEVVLDENGDQVHHIEPEDMSEPGPSEQPQKDEENGDDKKEEQVPAAMHIIQKAPPAMYMPKKHKCDKCPFSTNFSYSLKTHMLTHQGEKAKVFNCNRCPYRTALKHNLVVHQRTHTGETPYKCNVCGKMFSQHSTCRRHERTHSGEKALVCPYCPYSTFQNSHLQNHITELHGKIFTTATSTIPFWSGPQTLPPVSTLMPGFLFPQSQGPPPPLPPMSLNQPSLGSSPVFSSPSLSAYTQNLSSTTSELRCPQLQSPESIQRDAEAKAMGSEQQKDDVPARLPSVSIQSPGQLSSSAVQSSIHLLGMQDPANSAGSLSADDHDATDRDNMSSRESARISSTTQEPTDDQLLHQLISRGRVFRCGHCSILFMEYAMFLLHKSQHDSQNPWRCNFCGRVCNDKFDFMSHFVQFHQRPNQAS